MGTKELKHTWEVKTIPSTVYICKCRLIKFVYYCTRIEKYKFNSHFFGGGVGKKSISKYLKVPTRYLYKILSEKYHTESDIPGSLKSSLNLAP